jgi:glyoxylase-like metal-dependent hydrolase (beta-lactamase superfamily II)
MAKVHHLNCGTMCPRSSRFVTGRGGWTDNGKMVCHCLLIETTDGLILVDTGVGTVDVENPKGVSPPGLRAIIRPRLEREETAIAQVEALGFGAGEVRQIVMTHLDFDHAGGLPDFPEAEVHVFATEHDAMVNPSFRERPRYPNHYFAHGPRFVRHDLEGDDWFGFESVRVIGGPDAEVALVPVQGHSRGHCAVAVDSGGWLLHCGDAYFHADEMADQPSCPPGLVAFQGFTGLDHGQRRRNKQRLHQLACEHGDEIRMFCSHDAAELERMQAAGTAAGA